MQTMSSEKKSGLSISHYMLRQEHVAWCYCTCYKKIVFQLLSCSFESTPLYPFIVFPILQPNQRSQCRHSAMKWTLSSLPVMVSGTCLLFFRQVLSRTGLSRRRVFERPISMWLAAVLFCACCVNMEQPLAHVVKVTDCCRHDTNRVCIYC